MNRGLLMNREQWLTEMAKLVEPTFHGFELGDYKVTCGWPSRSALSPRNRVVGQCFHGEKEKGLPSQLFISPVLDQSLDVAGTLCHEIAHVAAGPKAKHGKWFIKVCKHVGLTAGPPKSVMPGELLNEKLMKLIAKLGPYPHTAIPIPPALVAAKPAPISVSLECTCGCTIRMKREVLESFGAPTCACGEEFVEEEGKGKE